MGSDYEYERKSKRSNGKSPKVQRSETTRSAKSCKTTGEGSISNDCSTKSKKNYKCWDDAYKKSLKRRRKEEENAKIIYRGIDNSRFGYIFEKQDGCGPFFVFCLQMCQTIYCLLAFLYSMLYNENPDEHVINFLMASEFFSTVSTMCVLGTKTASGRCYIISFQYIQLFVSLSLFIEYFDEVQKLRNASSLTICCSMVTISMVGACIHFVILLLSLDYIGTSEIKNNFEDEIIIESTERRKKKVFAMVAELFKNVCLGQNDAKVGVVVTDEDGNPVKLDGSVVKSDLDRIVRMKLSKNSVELLTENKTGTSLSLTPKRKQTAIQFVDNNSYNACTEQKDYISPTALLQNL